MRVTRLATLTATVEQILIALANRLTAEDNWGPEGEVGQVLTSRGPSDVDPPPHFANLIDILKGISPEELQGVPGLQGPPGAAGTAGVDGPTGPAGFMPTFIAEGESFEIPEFMQGLYTVPIDIEGELVINGVIAEVD